MHRKHNGKLKQEQTTKIWKYVCFNFLFLRILLGRDGRDSSLYGKLFLNPVLRFICWQKTMVIVGHNLWLGLNNDINIVLSAVLFLQ